MYARAVDDAGARLRELRQEAWQNLALAALALGLAVAAAVIRPSLALPLFLGGLVVGFLGVRALWRRWDLLERLAGERDAYVISEVLAFASRETTMERRETLAVMIRDRTRHPGARIKAHVEFAKDDLEALASDLDDAALALDPACAVRCTRLLSDVERSPLLNPQLAPDQLRAVVRQIRQGFTPVRLAA